MKNNNARFLLWLILIIGLLPAILQLFTPGVPELMVWVGIMVTVIIAVALVTKENNNLFESNKALTWLVSIWLVAMVVSVISNTNPTFVPMWLKWVAAITGLACAMIAKEKYHQNGRLTDWFNSRAKKMFRRS